VKPTETTAMQIYRSQSAHEAAVGLFHRGRAAGGSSLKQCSVNPAHVWAADIAFCPYCNFSPEARIAHLNNKPKKHL
jgi:DNA-binding helix-hairpin-helix protein with protein kinase domain